MNPFFILNLYFNTIKDKIESETSGIKEEEIVLLWQVYERKKRIILSLCL